MSIDRLGHISVTHNNIVIAYTCDLEGPAYKDYDQGDFEVA